MAKLIGLVLTTALLVVGCSGDTYRVAKLPREYQAPSTVNLEEINLSNLADRSISREQIQRGDVLDVSMVTDFSRLTASTTPVRVTDDGTVAIPLIGPVAVGGLEMEQAEQVIAAESKARGVFNNPSITVTMKQRRANKVTVVGAVKEPGTYELPRGANSLLAGLVAAGGLSKEAGADVEIRHTGALAAAAGGPQLLPPRLNDGSPAPGQPVAYQQNASGPAATTRVNMMAVSQAVQKTPELEDGDVVYVAKRAVKPIYVSGLVRKPGEFPFPINQDLRLLDAVALAGGCQNPAADKVLVIRQPPGQDKPIRIEASLQSAKSGGDNLQLGPGDSVLVEHTPLSAVVEGLQSLFRVGLGASVSLF